MVVGIRHRPSKKTKPELEDQSSENGVVDVGRDTVCLRKMIQCHLVIGHLVVDRRDEKPGLRFGMGIGDGAGIVERLEEPSHRLLVIVQGVMDQTQFEFDGHDAVPPHTGAHGIVQAFAKNPQRFISLSGQDETSGIIVGIGRSMFLVSLNCRRHR